MHISDIKPGQCVKLVRDVERCGHTYRKGSFVTIDQGSVVDSSGKYIQVYVVGSIGFAIEWSDIGVNQQVRILETLDL